MRRRGKCDILYLKDSYNKQSESFKGGVSGALGGADTGLAVLGVLVGEGELAQVPADHVELDFHDVECLAVVDCHVAAHHVGHDDAVPEVGLHGRWLLARLRVLLCLFAFHVQPVVSVFYF